MNRFNRNAFTIVEVLLVIVILGILAAIAIPQFVGKPNTAPPNPQIGTDLSFVLSNGKTGHQGDFFIVKRLSKTGSVEMFNYNIYKISKVTDDSVLMTTPNSDDKAPVPFSREALTNVQRTGEYEFLIVKKDEPNYGSTRTDFAKQEPPQEK